MEVQADVDLGFAHRLREAIGDHSVHSFAKKSGVTESLLRAYLAGKSLPGYRQLAKIAECAGTTVGALLGEHMPYEHKLGVLEAATAVAQELGLDDRGRERVFQSLKSVRALQGVREGMLPTDEYDQVPVSRYSVQESRQRLMALKRRATDHMDAAMVIVPRYDIKSALERKDEPLEDFYDGGISFRRDWLRERGIEPDAARLITHVGDAMRDTLFDGDDVLINTAESKLYADGIYLFRLDGRLDIKRMQAVVDGVVLHSDNKDKYPSVTIANEEMAGRGFEIVGRMHWFGREV